MGKVDIFVILVVSHLVLGHVGAVLKLDNESDLREAHAALFNVNSKSGWLLLNYVGPSTVHFAAGGEGGASEVVSTLQDNQVQYVLIREIINKTRGQTRDVFIQWIGPKVGIIEKGKKSALLRDAEAFLPFQSSLTVSTKAEFNDATIIDRSSIRSGVW